MGTGFMCFSWRRRLLQYNNGKYDYCPSTNCFPCNFVYVKWDLTAPGLTVDCGAGIRWSDGVFVLSMESLYRSCFLSAFVNVRWSPPDDDFDDDFDDDSFELCPLALSVLLEFVDDFLLDSLSLDDERSVPSLLYFLGSLILALPDFRNCDRISLALIHPWDHSGTTLLDI